MQLHDSSRKWESKQNVADNVADLIQDTPEPLKSCGDLESISTFNSQESSQIF